MYKKIIVLTVSILFLMMGYAALAQAQGKEGGIPVITQAFASKEVWPGQTWKVYLKASNPNGEMKNIFAVVAQPGVGEYPVSITRVREENAKELSGYIYLITSTPHHPLNFVYIYLTVNIQDRSGNFSAPAVFELFLNPRASQTPPPGGAFKEQELGPIMVRLKNIDGG